MTTATADAREVSPEAIITDWVSSHVGSVSRIERQGRWRPSWYVDVNCRGAVLKLYVRGARPGNWPPMPLEYECKVFQLFEASGLTVPHVFGFIADIPAIVMARAPGRTNLATAASDADRDAIRSELMDQMILMHRVDPELMQRAGAPRPDDDAEAGLTYYRLIERLFLEGRAAPAPAVEFVRRWLNRNIPANPDGARAISVDAAQFLFEGNKLTAMLDFEFAGLGDYHTDLAALRMRNRAEFIGDPSHLIQLYSKRSGKPVDLHRIRYHTAMIAILTPLQVARELAEPTASIDYHEYVIWNAFCVLIALDCIAEIKGYERERFTPPSSPQHSRYAICADALAMSIAGSSTSTAEFDRYRAHKQARVLRFLAKADAYRDAFDSAYRADTETLLGRPVSNWAEADAELERLAQQESPADEEALLRLFTRRYLRECFLLADPEDTVNYEQLSTRMEPLR